MGGRGKMKIIIRIFKGLIVLIEPRVSRVLSTFGAEKKGVGDKVTFLFVKKTERNLSVPFHGWRKVMNEN